MEKPTKTSLEKLQHVAEVLENLGNSFPISRRNFFKNSLIGGLTFFAASCAPAPPTTPSPNQRQKIDSLQSGNQIEFMFLGDNSESDLIELEQAYEFADIPLDPLVIYALKSIVARGLRISAQLVQIDLLRNVEGRDIKDDLRAQKWLRVVQGENYDVLRSADGKAYLKIVKNQNFVLKQQHATTEMQNAFSVTRILSDPSPEETFIWTEVNYGGRRLKATLMRNMGPTLKSALATGQITVAEAEEIYKSAFRKAVEIYKTKNTIVNDVNPGNLTLRQVENRWEFAHFIDFTETAPNFVQLSEKTSQDELVLRHLATTFASHAKNAGLKFSLSKDSIKSLLRGTPFENIPVSDPTRIKAIKLPNDSPFSVLVEPEKPAGSFGQLIRNSIQQAQLEGKKGLLAITKDNKIIYINLTPLVESKPQVTWRANVARALSVASRGVNIIGDIATLASIITEIREFLFPEKQEYSLYIPTQNSTNPDIPLDLESIFQYIMAIKRNTLVSSEQIQTARNQIESIVGNNLKREIIDNALSSAQEKLIDTYPLPVNLVAKALNPATFSTGTINLYSSDTWVVARREGNRNILEFYTLESPDEPVLSFQSQENNAWEKVQTSKQNNIGIRLFPTIEFGTSNDPYRKEYFCVVKAHNNALQLSCTLQLTLISRN